MAYIGNTGQGATLTLATTGAVGCVRSMQLPDWTVEKIDASCLDTTGYMRYISGDLIDPGDVEVVAVFDAAIDIPTPGVVEDITIDFPIGVDTNTTPAQLTGSGFISVSGLPNLAINELMELRLTVSFDGDTGPAFTKEAA